MTDFQRCPRAVRGAACLEKGQALLLVGLEVLAWTA